MSSLIRGWLSTMQMEEMDFVMDRSGCDVPPNFYMARLKVCRHMGVGGGVVTVMACDVEIGSCC